MAPLLAPVQNPHSDIPAIDIMECLPRVIVFGEHAALRRGRVSWNGHSQLKGLPAVESMLLVYSQMQGPGTRGSESACGVYCYIL